MTPRPYRLPRNTSEFSTELLEALIWEMHPGVSIRKWEILDARQRGEMVSTAGRVKLRIEYGQGSPPLPERVLVKMVIDGDTVNPVLYETETNVYRDYLPGLDIEKAVCLAATFEPETGGFFLMLEDLSAADAYFPNVMEKPLTAGQVGKLLDLLASVHAKYWQSPKLAESSDWLSSLSEGRQFEFFDKSLVKWIDTYVETIPYRADLVTRTGRTPAQLWEYVKAVHRHHERIFPTTLQHGDTGAHNSYHLPDGRCGFLDWQLSVRGAWPHDVHYTICTGLSVADRRIHERSLVERYLARLSALGIKDVPLIDSAMKEYARSIIWGFVVGWLMVPTKNYPAVIINANCERLFAAVTDNNTLALCEEVMLDRNCR
jgi:hypothetical protein